MTAIQLLNTTGYPRVDRILQGVIGLIEQTAARQVRAYYLTGSYATGTPTKASDIDLEIVLKNSAQQAQVIERLTQLDKLITFLCDLPLDLTLVGEQDLFSLQGEGPYSAISIKISGMLVYGEDIRNRTPLPEIDTFGRESLYTGASFFSRVRGDVEQLVYPLSYPDPHGAYWGYDNRQVILADGTTHRSLKHLVVSLSWTAGALLALQEHIYAVSKGETFRLYKERIGSPWADYLLNVDRVIRGQWEYLAPTTEAGQQEVRELCCRALEYENYVLHYVRDVALRDFHHPDRIFRRMALEALGTFLFPSDPIVHATLRTYPAGNDIELLELKQVALQRLSKSQLQQKDSGK